MSEKQDEKREYERYNFLHSIEYVLYPELSGHLFKGFTINISKSGLCICSPDALNDGQRVVIKTVLPFPLHNLTGTIRWSKKFNNHFFKAGLTFV